MEHWTLKQYKNYKQKNSKYGNKKMIIDGITFDSQKERKSLFRIKVAGKARINKRFRITEKIYIARKI